MHNAVLDLRRWRCNERVAHRCPRRRCGRRGLLTAVVSLFTGWLSRRHEHKRWLLDKRLELYLALNEALTTREKLDRGPVGDQIPLIEDLGRRRGDVQLVALIQTSRQTTMTGSAAAAVLEALQKRGDVDEAREVYSAARTDLKFRQRADVQVTRRDRRAIRHLLAMPPADGAAGSDSR